MRNSNFKNVSKQKRMTITLAIIIVTLGLTIIYLDNSNQKPTNPLSGVECSKYLQNINSPGGYNKFKQCVNPRQLITKAETIKVKTEIGCLPTLSNEEDYKISEQLYTSITRKSHTRCG